MNLARFLFVVPPLEGHVNPTVSVARELVSRGHEVAWAAHPGAVRRLLPEGAALVPLDDRLTAELLEQGREKARSVRGFASLKFLFEDFLLPLAHAMVPGVEAAVDSFEPAMVVADQQALAGALVARRREIPWTTFATTSAGVIEPFAVLPNMYDWLVRRFAELQRGAGLAVVERPDLSPHLVVVFSTQALVGSAAFPASLRFVGPSISDRHDPTPFPWELLRPVPRVLVTLGTVNAERGERFFSTAIEALGDRPYQVILVAPDKLVRYAPANILVRPRIPQLTVLPEVQAVVCHGGHNTVCESLAHGLPLIVAPIKDDQGIVAQQVVQAGAGIRLKFGRVRAPELRRAVERLLDEPAFREAAVRVQRSFADAGGAARAAELVEALL